MILQITSFFSSIFGGAPGAGLGKILGGVASRTLAAVTPLAIGVGQQFATGLINKELNRSSRNDFEDAIKAQLRAATNAVSPTVAPGQTAVFSGGPATGTAYSPPTLLPPSIQPPQRILQVNPQFAGGQNPAQFAVARRPPDLFVSGSAGLAQPVAPTNVGLASAVIQGVSRAGRAIGAFAGRRASQFDPRTPIGRQMIGLGAGAVAAETAVGVGADFIFPSTAEAPGFSGIASSGPPLRITEDGMPVVTGIPTGLPGVGMFQREANGCQVQWFFWNGDMSSAPQPVDRGAAAMVKREFIFRLNVFTGRFVRLKGRRMNPMNVRAFFRAGRRVDAGRRICRQMFSEHRKDKKGTVRRKSRGKKK